MEANDIAWAIDSALQESEKRTRRDRFAMAALAGLLSSAGPRDKVEDAAFVAVKAADLTIAELDKQG